MRDEFDWERARLSLLQACPCESYSFDGVTCQHTQEIFPASTPRQFKYSELHYKTDQSTYRFCGGVKKQTTRRIRDHVA